MLHRNQYIVQIRLKCRYHTEQIHDRKKWNDVQIDLGEKLCLGGVCWAQDELGGVIVVIVGVAWGWVGGVDGRFDGF